MNLELSGLIIPTIISLSGYFLSRAIARVDSLTKSDYEIREEIGKLKMINEAQWKFIDELRDQSRK